MLIIVIIISGLLLAAIIIRPFWGLLLLWPVLLCYPHAIMKDLLPLNVGFDDLFVTFVFVAVVTRCVASGQLRFGRWGLLVSTFWLIYMSSNVFGMIYTNIEEAMVFVAKDTIKQISVLMIALAVLNGIQEANQIRRLVRWYYRFECYCNPAVFLSRGSRCILPARRSSCRSYDTQGYWYHSRCMGTRRSFGSQYNRVPCIADNCPRCFISSTTTD